MGGLLKMTFDNYHLGTSDAVGAPSTTSQEEQKQQQTGFLVA